MQKLKSVSLTAGIHPRSNRGRLRCEGLSYAVIHCSGWEAVRGVGEMAGMVTQIGAESDMCAWPHGGSLSTERALDGRRSCDAVSRARGSQTCDRHPADCPVIGPAPSCQVLVAKGGVLLTFLARQPLV